MKHSVVLIFCFMLFTCSVFVSCSAPSPDAESMLKKNTTSAQTTPQERPVDITGDVSGTETTETSEVADASKEATLKNNIAPDKLAKLADQVAATEKVWKKSEEQWKASGVTPFLFNLEEKIYTNGEPLKEMGGEPSPIPLFETWDATKISGVEQLQSVVSHGLLVVVKSRRKSTDGNWYLITPFSSGLETVKGWVPEAFLSKLEVGTGGGFKGTEAEGGGGGRRGGGNRENRGGAN